MTTIDKNMSVQRFLGSCFVLGCLNPWTSFGTNDMDSQPWALLFGVFFVLSLGEIKKPERFSAILALITAGLLITISTTENLGVSILLRSLGSYLTFIVCLLGFYNYLFRYGFPTRVVIASGYSWVAFGIIDLFFPQVTGMLSPTRTTLDRGVTSLAPEPTFFGIFLFFLAWILLESSNFRPTGWTKALVFLSLAAIILLSKSSMTVLYIALSLLALIASKIARALNGNLMMKRKIFYLLIATIAVAPLFTFAASHFLEGSRLAKIVSDLGNYSISDIILSDASINARVESLVMSIYGAANNFGLPGGLDTFAGMSERTNSSWGYVFWYQGAGDKIMSWLGAWAYELGFLGVLAVSLCALGSRRGAPAWRIFLLLFLTLSAIPVAFPLIPMIFAMWMLPDQYASWRSSQRSSNV